VAREHWLLLLFPTKPGAAPSYRKDDEHADEEDDEEEEDEDEDEPPKPNFSFIEVDAQCQTEFG
jgi:hypothetical protein